jgi:DNA-binding SARP family transcriptional activator
LLGPFEVIREGSNVTPSAPKLRQVLALLAVHANRVVRTDQLIEELWEDRPPLSATTTLQTYVYQLRKLFSWRVGEEPGVTLRTSPGGYMLGLPADALDSQRFEHLAEQGQLALAAGDHAKASEILGEAQRLWRGRALTSVDAGPVLHVQAVRLEELHKVVVEQRLDADLRLGRHLGLIGELRTLVSQQPTHEGFQAKLMLALYRSGRRSEALAVFQHSRAILNDELGLEPSMDLQRLHRAILAASPALDVSAESAIRRGAAAAVAEPPSQLPADVPHLYGQENQLEQVVETLTCGPWSAPRLAFVVGAPASGKSVFAVHAGHRLRKSFPDGQLYAALTGPDGTPAEPSRVMAGFLAAIGVPADRIPVAAEERIQLFRSWTANRRVLVVLDDVTDVHQLIAFQPSGAGCGTIATGRRRIADTSISLTTSLDRLSPAASTALLTQALGNQRVSIERAALGELVRRCDGLPGALRSVASCLQMRPHWSLREYLDMADGEPRRLRANIESALGASLDRTARIMPQGSWAAFRTLAANAAGPISPLAAAMILNCDEITAEALLEDLVVFQLAEIEDIAEGTGACRFRYQLRLPLRLAARLLDPAEPEPSDLAVAQPALVGAFPQPRPRTCA